jgi:hypothetical protein
LFGIPRYSLEFLAQGILLIPLNSAKVETNSEKTPTSAE